MKYISIGFLAEFHIQLLSARAPHGGIGAIVLFESEAAVIAILNFCLRINSLLENSYAFSAEA
jgi:hypothetical protein